MILSSSLPDSSAILFTAGKVVFPQSTFEAEISSNHPLRSILSLSAFVVAVPVSKGADENQSPEARIGTICRVIQRSLQAKRGNMGLTLEGLIRVRVGAKTGPGIHQITTVEEPDREGVPAELSRALFAEIARMMELANTKLLLGRELRAAPIGKVADAIASSYNFEFQDQIRVLETIPIKDRTALVLQLLRDKLNATSVTHDIDDKVKQDIKKSQRDFYLRQQLKTIKKELGDDDGSDSELGAFEQRIKESGMPQHVADVANKELSRLRRMNHQQSEYEVTRSYLECLIDMPWARADNSELDMAAARKILEEAHHGMEEPNRRILEYIAVRKLAPSANKGPILCLLGPPGVGKTSLGASFAKALGRKLVRVSLGGVVDEADIRGHRRTYVGAMPGRIVQAIKTAGVKNPVMLLDEVDKTGQHMHRGNVTSALLEVLDPEQNDTFVDHYLNVPFDLSECVFVATANSRDDIPGPLRDRMEIISISGYTPYEKLSIGSSYLLPKQLPRHGLVPPTLTIPAPVLGHLIRRYTHEAGVRDLDRKIAAICRHVALQIAEDTKHKSMGMVMTDELLEKILGAPRYEEEDIQKRMNVPGVVVGLVWTAAGGDTMFVEACAMRGKGRIVLTGQLGDVIKESAHIAVSWVRSHMSPPSDNNTMPPLLLGSATNNKSQPLRAMGPTDPNWALMTAAVDHAKAHSHHGDGTEAHGWFDTNDLHIHFPAGAIPKDGPSAGVTLVTVLVSLLKNQCVRSDTAMTGEVTLNGHVLAVGGIKEKVLAAHTAGIKRVILPQANKSDLQKLPENVRQSMKFILVEQVEQVLANAFAHPLTLSKL